MYQEDYLLRMIRRMVAAVARFRAGPTEPGARDDLEGEIEQVLGMSLSTIEALPTSALLGILRPDDAMARERIEALADALEALAAIDRGASSEARRSKAAQLREAAARSG